MCNSYNDALPEIGSAKMPSFRSAVVLNATDAWPHSPKRGSNRWRFPFGTILPDETELGR